jgi:hypothetical protein
MVALLPVEVGCNTPAESLCCNKTLTGKANFGFTKYKKEITSRWYADS